MSYHRIKKYLAVIMDGYKKATKDEKPGNFRRQLHDAVVSETFGSDGHSAHSILWIHIGRISAKG